MNPHFEFEMRWYDNKSLIEFYAYSNNNCLDEISSIILSYIQEKTGEALETKVNSTSIIIDIIKDKKSKAFHKALANPDLFIEGGNLIGDMGFSLNNIYILDLSKLTQIKTKGKKHCPYCNGTGQVVVVNEKYPCMCRE